MADQYFMVGAIAGVHGLRGEVKVIPKTDFESERFSPGSKLFVRKPSETPFRELVVRSARKHKQFWLVAFDGFSSVSDVETWRGMQLCVHQSQLMHLPEGTYYVHQLVGLRVVDEVRGLVGELISVLSPGANDVYVVRGPLQPRDVLIPAIPDCVKHVDLSQGVMTVHLLPGLLDDDTGEDVDQTDSVSGTSQV